MIPNDFIQTLLGRVDIVEVVDRHVPLKKAGANYQACCPFHSEKTPSFTVSPTKQFYHCFGCGAHGTAIGFLMEYAGKSFPEAVEDLARDAGLTVPRVERPGEAERREEVTDQAALLLTAAKFYRSELRNAPHAIDYLKRRGLTGAVAARFGIGYAPDGWQPLARAFASYDDPALDQAGLVIRGDAQKRYDRFRDRIMFPIHDSRGRVIGFGGRVLGQGEPKYLNSPETALFSKGRELYGLYLARRAIRDAGRVVVVEGYMDVVALAQSGVEYAVATLGTATTPLHVQKLLRQADEIVFSFDGDAAGRRAAWRALENSLVQLQDGKQLKFLFLPDGEDPDTYVRKHGKDAFEKLLSGATPLSRFLLDELSAKVDLATAEGRAKCLHEAKPLVKQIQANGLRLQLVREFAERCRVSPEEVSQLFELGTTPARSRPPQATVPRKPVASVADQLLRLLVANPACVRKVTAEQRTLLDAPEFAPVLELIHALAGSDAPTPAMLEEATRESRYAGLYRDLAGQTLAVPGDDETAAADLAGLFNKLELDHVQSEYQRLTASGVRDEHFQEISRRLAELKKGPAAAESRPRA